MPGKAAAIWNAFFYGTVLTYSTPKVVKIPNTYIAIIHRLLQLVIFIYIIGYIVVWKKGYQQFQEPRGTCVIKVKGIAKIFGNATLQDTGDANPYVWDTPEYEIPPIENNAFFIATHQTITPEQKQGVCPTALADNLLCDDGNKTLCKTDQAIPEVSGYFTGECVPSNETANVKVCEMRGWCPEELSKSTDYVISENDLRTFTIFFKTLVTFTLFKKNLRNINDNTNFKCRFDGTPANIDCPILPISYILDQIPTNRSLLLLKGGLIEIRQDWRCNFDVSPDKCIPTYDFSLLQSGDDKQSPGINYRYAQKYRQNGIEYRTLAKVYGLRFVIAITGQGGRFYIVNLFVAIGSGIGFMALASIVADFVLMNVHKFRDAFRKQKYDVFEGDEDGKNKEPESPVRMNAAVRLSTADDELLTRP